MAKNKEPGDERRVGAVKRRSQIRNKLTGTWTKRSDKTGEFLDVKADAKPFKGVRKKGAGMKSAAAKKSSARKAVGRVVRKAPVRGTAAKTR